MRTSKNLGAIGGALLAAGLIAGVAMAAPGGTTDTQSVAVDPVTTETTSEPPSEEWVLSTGEELVTSNFPINDAGQSYGSEFDATSPEELPDLIAVISDAGDLGFVYTTEYYPEFASRGEVAEYQEEIADDGGVKVLTVYDTDGSTVLGTFTMG